ncbi:MAG: PA2779 family protein [Steroidobacteraceae bacterium]
MNTTSPWKRHGVYALCVLSLSATWQPSARADIIDTQTVIELTSRAAELARVDRALSADSVKSRLLLLGVERDSVDARLASLTDRELASFADRLDTAPAGGDGLALVGAVFVVLLILELVGVIDVFKNVGSSRR